MGKIDVENAKILRQALDVVITMGDEIFTTDNLIECNVTLRGTQRDISEGTFSQEGSEIDFSALVDGSADTWINFIKEQGAGAEITYSSGYIGEEMSDTRTFYLQETDYDAKTKVLTCNGVDATIFKLDIDYSGAFIQTTSDTVRADYYNVIKGILDDAGITYTEAGSVVPGGGSVPTNIFFDAGNSREIIAEASGLYKNEELAITYRDAGRPQLIAGDAVSFWELNESDVSEFTLDIQRHVKEYDVTLPTYSVGGTEEIASVSDCVVGQSYFEETSEPIYSIGSTQNCTAEKLGLHTIKINCTTSGTCVVNGRRIISSTLISDAPRRIIDAQSNGLTVDLSTIQKLNAEDGSLTASAVESMIKEPTEIYKFTFRGDPRIQPSDIIRVYRYTGGRVRPADTLYPANDLVPDGDAYVDMRVQSITLEHSQGGLSSEVEARVLVLYETPNVFYPLESLYPSNSIYPA